MKRRTVRLLCSALLVPGALMAVPAAEADVAAAGWTKQAPLPTSDNLASVSAISADEAWVASAPLLGDVGAVAHTADGGKTWSVAELPRQVNAVFFLDDQHGWAAGNSFFHTTDGGKTWTQDNEWGTIYDLYFLDANHGWAAGNGAVTYYTSDGGRHWNYRQTG